MTVTATTSRHSQDPAVAVLEPDIRQRLVRHILDQTARGDLDRGTAALMLDGIGLTGDADAIATALAARYMRDGLLDHTIDVREVDPQTRPGMADIARDQIAADYDAEYETAVRALAAVRPVPVPVEVPEPSLLVKALEFALPAKGKRRRTVLQVVS